MGKASVPPAVVCKSSLMQAGRLLFPLFHSSLRNKSYHKKFSFLNDYYGCLEIKSYSEQPQHGGIYQPRATPWVNVNSIK